MAQSRVQNGKGKKSKFPMWGLGIIVVLVVVIAGYAIVRFSKASGSGDTVVDYPVKDIYGGGGSYIYQITKSNGTRMTVWAVPKDAYVVLNQKTVYPFKDLLNYSYSGRRLTFCATAQRLNGDIGQATILGEVFVANGQNKITGVLNIGASKRYCTIDVGEYLDLKVPSSQYKIFSVYIQNKSVYPLYVSSLGYSY